MDIDVDVDVDIDMDIDIIIDKRRYGHRQSLTPCSMLRAPASLLCALSTVPDIYRW